MDINLYDLADRSEAFVKAASYFKRRGPSNDFTFPGDLLDLLENDERIYIEKIIFEQCLVGDYRFFSAAGKIKNLELSERITDIGMIGMREISRPYRRADFLKQFYLATNNQLFLKNLVFLVPHDRHAAVILSRVFEEQDWWDRALLESPEYYDLLIALRTILITFSNIGKQPYFDIFILRRKGILGTKDFIKVPFLAKSKRGLMLDHEIWDFDGCHEYRLFWEALNWRLDYIETGNLASLEKIIEHSYEYPEIYAILHSMIKYENLGIQTVLNERNRSL